MIPLCDPEPDHLRAGLDAVLAEAPEAADMEIVLVDDASRDIAWLDRLLEDLELGDRVRLVRREQRVGIGRNWNDCVRHARGAWVHILHQDDLVRPGFHDRLRALIVDFPDAGAAFCRDTVIDSAGRTVGSQRLIRPTPGIVDDWIEHIFVGLHLRASALVVRRAVYEALGGFRLDLDYALDWDMWKRIAAARPLAYLPEALVSYRRHAASASNGFQRSGANLVEIARSIALSESLLPAQSAVATTRRTRENYARYGANLAWNALAEGDLCTAAAQLRGARRLGSTGLVARTFLQRARRAWRDAPAPRPASPAARDPSPAALMAVAGRDLARLRQVLQSGADPDAVGASGMTALGQAVIQGDVACVAALVEHGASLDRPVLDDQTPLDLAVRWDCPEVAALLLARGADANAPGRHRVRPLNHAIASDRPAIAALLLAHGADVEAVGIDGMPPLCHAIAAGQPAIAAALIERGADVRRACRDGTTALHLAMAADWTDLARRLVERGADPEARDRAGRAPVDLAVSADAALFGNAASVDVTPADLAAVTAGQTVFAAALYVECARDAGNLVFSPSSIATVLSMTHAGARGETMRELAAALRLPAFEPARLHAAAGALAATASRAPGIEISVANAMFVQQGEAFVPDFVTLLAECYRSALRQVDFASPDNAAAVINAWVSAQTRGLIGHLVDASGLDALTRLVLANAIYLKGTWASQFAPAATEEAPFFHLDGSSTPAQMMFQSRVFRLVAIDGGQAIELPYRGGAVAMVVFLPTRRDGLPAMEAALPSHLPRWLEPFAAQGPAGAAGAAAPSGWIGTVDVYLPRFRFEYSVYLAPHLRALGIRRAFDAAAADLSGILPTGLESEPLYVSKVLHRARIEVDEEGTTAVAVTGMQFRSLGIKAPPPPPPVFRADHPFLFLIRDRRTACVLFLGRVVTVPGPD